VVDAVDVLAASDPDFPWADYDVEDQGDADGDGNLFEPDGVIVPGGRREGQQLHHAGRGRRGRGHLP
jgi:immune inhibitor A